MSALISKLVKVFIKSNFPNGSKVIDGVRYTLEESNQSDVILVYIDLVDDISTIRYNLIGTFEDLLYDFSKFASSKGGGPSTFYLLKEKFRFYTSLSKNEIYLTDSDRQELLGIYNKIKKINVRIRTNDDEIIDIDFSASFIDASISGNEIIVRDNVKILSLYVDGYESNTPHADLHNLLESEDDLYDYFREQGPFSEIINFFWSKPRIINPDSDVFVVFNHNWVW